MFSPLYGVALGLLATCVWADSRVVRQDFSVASDPGVRLFVREIKTESVGEPVLLLHGARVPGIGSFDLPVANGSLAADLAGLGFDVYLMDVRGYGKSTRPAEMNEPPEKSQPLVRSDEAVRDIGAVVEWIRGRRHGAKVALLGWATGGHWAGYYASLHSEKISALILLNTLYAGSDKHPSFGHGSDLEDPQHAGHFDPKIGGYRFNTESSLFGAWNRSIPVEDKDSWRDPAIAKAYAEAALASDTTSGLRTPPSFRSPNGALEDSFYLAVGRQLWDASLIRVPALIVAGERDFWSRPEDREKLVEHLVHAPKVKAVVIPGATHFVHLDRPQRGREQLLREVKEFLTPTGQAR
ncbi:MAG: alpha/beta fold hydrolase [Acidobacteria bacterium]|nr:alpha/beta fold hydrolase [Acidobacteriota bacterium]